MAHSTYSAPGSLLRSASSAEASRTTLLTLRFPPPLFDELVGEPSIGRAEDHSEAVNGVADREHLQLARFLGGHDQPVTLPPAEPREERLRQPHLSRGAERDRFRGERAVRHNDSVGPAAGVAQRPV